MFVLLILAIVMCIVKRKVAKKKDTIVGSNISPTRYEMSHPERSRSMEMKKNDAYITKTANSVDSVDSDQLYATVDEEHAKAAATTMNISMETNTCYGTTTPSVDPDQLYETVEEQQSITHTKIHVEENDYNDYVIP